MDKFPPLYDTQDFFKCIQNEHTFCVVDAKLWEGPQNSTIWNDILESIKSQVKHDRSYLHRGICLASEKTKNLTESVTNVLADEISDYNLTVGIDMMYCQKGVSHLSAIDIIFLFLVSSIILAVVIGTIMDSKVEVARSSLGNSLLKFSLRTNWKKIVKTAGNEEFTRLKSMQGIRALTMLGVFGVHTLLGIANSYFQNPEHVEEILSARGFEQFATMGIFLVHIFMVMSAFLFVNQIYNHYEKNGSLSFRDVLVLISNRYLRLYVPTVLFVLYSTTSLYENFSGSPGLKMYKMNKNSCENSWASVMLFSNNFSPIIEQCYPTIWYLSVDFQAYILIALIVYVILKYKFNSLKVMLQVLLTSILVFAVYIFIRNPKQVVLKGSLSNMQHFLLKPVENYITLYTSTMSTLPTSFTGMVFGYIYYRTKNYKINKNVEYEIAFHVISYGLPGLSVYLSLQNYNRLFTALIGSIVKVVFTTGIACAIIAMSFGIGGTTKRILESKFFIILGNISFTAYLCNFLCCLVVYSGLTHLQTFSFNHMIAEYLYEAFASIVCGLFVALLVEQPALSLQKMILPQLRKTIEVELKKE